MGSSRSSPAGRSPASRPAGRFSRRTQLTSRAAVLALVVGVLVLALTYPIRAYFAQRTEIEALRERTAEQRERVAALREQRDRWNDPAFVKAQARQRLHFVMPGETGYVAVPPRRPSTGTAGQQGPG